MMCNNIVTRGFTFIWKSKSLIVYIQLETLNKIADNVWQVKLPEKNG
jgi:hypothetical protein